jgi:hypothetical protein
MAERKRDPAAQHSHRLKEPLSPSVRGTAKQSRREDKGDEAEFTTTHFAEGTGHQAGGGRGGKADRG